MSENDEKWTLVGLLANLIEEARDEPHFTAAEHALMAAGEIERAGFLARPLPTRDEIADELAGWPLGSGYYSVSVPVDEAQAMADAVLTLLEGENR